MAVLTNNAFGVRIKLADKIRQNKANKKGSLWTQAERKPFRFDP